MQSVIGKDHMGGDGRLAHTRGYRRDDDRFGITVSFVVLDDDHWAHTALFTAHYRRKIRIIYISASDHYFITATCMLEMTRIISSKDRSSLNTLNSTPF